MVTKTKIQDGHRGDLFNTVHPRLSEQAELNLKTGRSNMPKIRIIEDRLNQHQNE